MPHVFDGTRLARHILRHITKWFTFLRADGSAFLMLRNTVIVNIGFSEQWPNARRLGPLPQRVLSASAEPHAGGGHEHGLVSVPPAKRVACWVGPSQRRL